jgi:outer membrane protein TolC
MSDDTAGRGEGFIEQIRAVYPPELAEQIIEAIRRRDDQDHAENQVNEATFWLGAELGGRDIERDFRTLDQLLRDHPDYFDQ